MCDLILHTWLVSHMDIEGDNPLEWNDSAKDSAADMAINYCQNPERLKDCMVDFFADGGLVPLYEYSIGDKQKINKLRNNIWACIESEIVDQCEAIVESRGLKE